MPQLVKERLDEPMGVSKHSNTMGVLLAESAQPAAKKEIAPVLIVYDDRGDAQNSQQASTAADSTSNAVEISITDPLADEGLDIERKRAVVFANVHLAHRMLGKAKQEEQVNIVGDPAKASSLKVFARVDLQAGSLLLLPLVPSPQFITSQSTHPDRVPTSQCDLEGRPLDIAPCARLPKVKVKGLRAAGGGAKGESAWVAPLWHIQRQKYRTTSNCVMTTISITSIATIGAYGDVLQLDEPLVVSDDKAQVPVCTNVAALAAGDELVLFKEAGAHAKAKAKNKKEKTWMQEKDALDCARATKKAKKATE